VIDGGMTWLAIIAAINMAIGLYYYVRVIAQMYLHPTEYDFRLPPRTGWTIGYAACFAGTIVLGIWPRRIITFVDFARDLLR
jgi:NADH-quinone oxidoreductase subunit N